jgi:predicted transcriptional regulator
VAGRRAMGELESEVLTILWAADGARTPAEVLDALEGDVAYTTAMTILSRLWQKGLAEREPRGRAYAYRPKVSEAELAAQRMQATLARTHDREAALARFVGSLSKKDERALRHLLDRLDTEG